MAMQWIDGPVPEERPMPPLPKPAFRLKWNGVRACYTVTEPNIGDTDVYTAEQLLAYGEAVRDEIAR